MIINTHLFGLGKIGFYYELNKKKNIKNHFKAIEKHKSFHLKTIHDKDPKKIKKFLKNNKFNEENINNLKIIKKKDLVIISVDTNQQYKVLSKLIINTKPKVILCEKPFCETLAQQNKILNLCRKKKIKLFVNYIRNSDPNYLKILKCLETKNELYNIKIFYQGGILNNASHYLNFLTVCFGKPRQYKIMNSTKIKKTKNDYNFDFVIKYKNAEAKFIHKNYKTNLEMIFESKKNKFKFYKNTKSKLNKKFLAMTINRYQHNVIDNIYKYYNKNKHNLCTGDQAKQTLKICKNIIKLSNE